MSIEKVLYGTKIGSPSYMEEIISTDESIFAKAKTWAKANGYDRLRIAEIDLSVPPNFSNLVSYVREPKK